MIKTSSAALAAFLLLSWLGVTLPFAPVPSRVSVGTSFPLFSTPTKEDKDTEEEKDTLDDKAITTAQVSPDPDAEGLPWWWDLVWKLDMMKKGEPGDDIIFGDSANVLRTNIEQIYGGFPSLDGCPLAEGDISDIADGTMFIGLQRYFENYQVSSDSCRRDLCSRALIHFFHIAL